MNPQDPLSSSPTQDPRYNWVYKELVANEGDVTGALAYVLYKQEKIAFIADFVSKNQRQPDDTDLAPFHAMTRLSQRLDAYRVSAELLMEVFLDNVLAEKLNEFTTNVRDDAIVKAVKTSWLRGVFENVVASVFTTALTFLALLCMLVYTEGPAKIFGNALAKLASDTPPVSAPTPPTALDGSKPNSK